ncbi:unnamed protein product [Lupinus luteus]|uniref:Uncharacterized protein n=1 Tax=Lupinus luteus TaxID=3873 RepID=A0AAV1W757_LUPLU
MAASLPQRWCWKLARGKLRRWSQLRCEEEYLTPSLLRRVSFLIPTSHLHLLLLFNLTAAVTMSKDHQQRVVSNRTFASPPAATCNGDEGDLRWSGQHSKEECLTTSPSPLPL